MLKTKGNFAAYWLFTASNASYILNLSGDTRLKPRLFNYRSVNRDKFQRAHEIG